LAAATLSLATLAGCAGPASHNGIDGTTLGFIYTSQAVPSSRAGLTNFQQSGPGFSIAGNAIEVESTATNILGWIAQGDTGYKNLLDKAKAAGADGVVDAYFDAKITNILGLYCKVDYRIYGTPIKFKR
jgi:hypothetical protein